MFPTPQEIGLPGKFREWRPNQPRVIQDALECRKRAKVQLQRAGAGKTVSYLATALMRPNFRTGILTVNKALQDQLLDDFASVGLVDIRGKATYDCQGRPGHSCETGGLSKCAFKGTGICPHFSARSAALESSLLTTNYSCWMAGNRYGNGLGKFDLLILDEAHEAGTQLAKAMQVRISEQELASIKHDWPDHRSRGDMEAWKYWALVAKNLSDAKVVELEGSLAAKPKVAEVERYKHMKNLSRKLADIHMARADNWVSEEWAYGYQFDPINPSVSAERFLLSKIENLILTSGTIHPRTVEEELGLGEEDYQFFEYHSAAKPGRSPIYWLKTLSVTRKVQDWELVRCLVRAIDEIIGSRIDRKGVIHTASFRMRDLIVNNSKYGRYMISNYGSNGTTGALIESFKRMEAPAWFVSPSLGTGVDLPHSTCRVQIIAKLPFGDRTSKVERERERRNPTLGMFKMFQRLEQQVWRADRADDDWQEVFILDDLFSWAMWKFPDLVPPSILPYYRPIEKVPVAPELG